MDKMILMVWGHEMWLEVAKAEESNVDVKLAYGHNMKLDGTPEKDRLTSLVFADGGEKLQPDLKPVDGHFEMTFKGEKPGYYTPFVNMSALILTNTKDKSYQRGPKKMYTDVIYSGAFHQMAKTIVPVGNVGEFKPEHVHGILDIVPDQASLKAGGNVRLTVLYEGNPLPGIEVKAVSKNEGTDMATVKTDKSGVALVPVMTDGLWMFLVRHKDPAKAVPDEYDEAVFVTTLAMNASN